MTDHLKNKLEAEKEILISDLREIGMVKNRKIPDDWQAVPDKTQTQQSDINELSDRIESYENNTALVRQLEIRLMEVDKALAKLKSGKYGLCEICNKHIEPNRLEANPAAPTCKEHMNTPVRI